jgi:hypothetical protein
MDVTCSLLVRVKLTFISTSQDRMFAVAATGRRIDVKSPMPSARCCHEYSAPSLMTLIADDVLHFPVLIVLSPIS